MSLRVLITGHRGYIGSVMAPILREAGHSVTGLDSRLYDGCDFGPGTTIPVTEIRRDVRDVTAAGLAGFDAIVHMAGIANDPTGDLRPTLTYETNHGATMHLARMAKMAGVTRFLFASSCSVYGVQDDEPCDESRPPRPITPYGEAQLVVERDLAAMASAEFSPVYLRSATAYGVSPRLRADLIVNNLAGQALTDRRVTVPGDGAAWRPLAHVEDIARAFVAVLEAPRSAIHDEVFNIGATNENYRIIDVANMVASTMPGCRVLSTREPDADGRDYRVDFRKLRQALPAYRPLWTVRRGVEQLLDAYLAEGLTLADFEGGRFHRVRRLLELRASGQLDESLRWSDAATAAQAPA